MKVGYVVGVLGDDLCINEDAAMRCREAAGEAPLTFHRGFDRVPDRLNAAATLIRLGYQRVLTTGGDPAVARPDALRELVTVCGNDLIILASGGLRSTNVAEIVSVSGATEVHMRAPGPDGGTDETEVRAILRALRA